MLRLKQHLLGCSEMELTGDAIVAIEDFYAELRAGGQEAALPITVRTLETIIRLSTAAAKARLAPGTPSLPCCSPVPRCSRCTSQGNVGIKFR